MGDAIEVRDGVTGQWALIPLAGPANRQGRIAADNILGRPSRYEHTWGTAILRLFTLTAGCTGANEKTLRRADIPFQSIHLHPNSHAGYFPGAHPIAMKVLFAPDTGRLLGAQAVGHDGVDKRRRAGHRAQGRYERSRLNSGTNLRAALRIGKGSVNFAGMAAQNVLTGDVALAQWNEVASLDPSTTLLSMSAVSTSARKFHSRLNAFHWMSCASVWVSATRTRNRRVLPRAANALTTQRASEPTASADAT